MTETIVEELSKPTFTKEFAHDVKAGLSAKSKYLKPKYFYDYTGSELFEEICRQPEYYLTRTEASILETYSSDIANMHTNSSRAIIELGSGSSSKTRILLEPFVEGIQLSTHNYYFPIDISHSMLQGSVNMLSKIFPKLKIMGLSTDYFNGIDKASQFLSNENVSTQMVIVFLGSSIGNFNPDEAEKFLKLLADRLNEEDSLLIGFDLHKNQKILNSAYNDAAGITAKFNLNILHRINKELGGDFDLRLFKHRAFYNKDKRRVEMHLVSMRKQQVYIREIDETFDFDAGETIHTENSYKYTSKQIDALAKRCNLRVNKHFIDRNRWFDLAMFKRVA